MSAIIRRRGLIGAEKEKLWIVKNGVSLYSVTPTRNSIFTSWTHEAPVVSYASNLITASFAKRQGTNYRGSVSFGNIDISNYNKLCVECSGTIDGQRGNAYGSADFGITPSYVSNFSFSKASNILNQYLGPYDFDGKQEIDISEKTGSQEVVLNLGVVCSVATGISVSISNIWLEK